MGWDAVTAIATTISMVAFILSALYVREQLRASEQQRFLAITNELFTTWQSKEFMESQLWLLYRLEETTWEEFVKSHRGDVGEAAFHRVGSFYDRVGTLVRLGLIHEEEILSTLGAYAIATWQKMEPLVRDARRIENSVLFDDFERLLPACYECYVPSLGPEAQVRPFSLDQSSVAHGSAEPPTSAGAARPEPTRLVSSNRLAVPPAQRNAKPGSKTLPEPTVERIDPAAVQRRLKRGEVLTLLDVRQPAQVEKDPQTLPGAIWIPPDQVVERYGELPPGKEVIASCA